MRDRLALGALVAWIAVSAILLGSVPETRVDGEGWFARFLSSSGAYILFLGLGAVAALLAYATLPGGPAKRLSWLLALLLLLGIFQELPLPRGLHALIAPDHARDAEILLEGRTWIPISTDRGLTSSAVNRLAILLLGGFAVLGACRDARRAFIVIAALVATSAAISAYGILEAGFLGDRVLGFSREFLGKDHAEGAVTGTFIYRGNFAAFAAAGLGAAAAGLVQAFKSRRPALAGGAVVALVLLTTGLLLSRSRAGLLAGGLALAVGLVLPLRSRAVRVGIAAAVIVAVLGAGLGLTSLRERFEYLGTGGRGFLDVRLPAWGSTLELFRGRPLMGCGLGTYRRAIHLTQSVDNPDELWFAHSDPLNLLAEGGVIGFGLGAMLVALGLLGAFRLARSRDSPAAGVGAACAAALCGLLAMAAVDFPLQIPALSLVFIVLIYLPARLRMPVDGREMSRKRRLVASLLVVLLAGWAIRCAVIEGGGGSSPRPFDAKTRLLRAGLAYEARDLAAARSEVRAAYRVSRGKPELLFSIGTVALADSALADLAPGALREAGTIRPDLFPKALRLLESQNPGLAPKIVPEKSAAWPDPEKAWAILKRWYIGRGEELEGRRVFQGVGVPWKSGSE